MNNKSHTKNGVPRGISGYLIVAGNEEEPAIGKYAVGEIVRWFHKRERVGMDLFEGVVLDTADDGELRQKLFVWDSMCGEPEVVGSDEVEKIEFKHASEECQILAKATLFLKNSKKYLRL